MADWKPPPAPKKDEPKVLLLPPKNKDCNRVIEYLFGRGIDYHTLRQFTSGRKENTARNYLEKLSESDYTGKRILLVEDNELNREIGVEILQMTGAEVETAENGKIAVEKVEASPKGSYDLIFMDIQMPVMNGYEATAAIRSLPGEKGKLPIVAMTANAFAEDVQLAKNTGMNGHIAKPLDMNKLNDVLENWL